MKVGMQILSFLIAGYFAFTLMIAGLAKVDSPYSLTGTLRAIRLLPDAFVKPLTRIIAWGEITLALWLVSGVLDVPAAAINLTLFIGFFVFKIVVARRKLLTDCGCFGETYRRNIDSASITVSVVQVLLAVLNVWFVTWAEPPDKNLRLIVLTVFLNLAIVILWRIQQRRKPKIKTA